MSEFERLLPRVFVASDGREPVALPASVEHGVLLRDLDLVTLVGAAEAGPGPIALDLDSVDGLNADGAAVRFVTRHLGIEIVMTRRAPLAALVAEAGGVGLVHAFAFDSTGLGRTLEGHPRQRRVGTVISPGPVLTHLSAADLARLPRPILAYGLIDTAERARRLLTIADSVAIGADCARDLLSTRQARSSDEAARGGGTPAGS